MPAAVLILESQAPSGWGNLGSKALPSCVRPVGISDSCRVLSSTVPAASPSVGVSDSCQVLGSTVPAAVWVQ